MPVAGHSTDKGQQWAGIPPKQGAHGLTVALGHSHHQILVSCAVAAHGQPPAVPTLLFAQQRNLLKGFFLEMPFYGMAGDASRQGDR